MTPLSMLVLAALSACIATARSRWAALSLLLGVFYLTQAQAIDVLGVNLYPLRFLEVVAILRILVRGEMRFSRLTRIDRWVLATYAYAAAIWVLRAPHFEAQQVGFALDPIMCYLAFRSFIAGLPDLRWLLSTFAIFLAPYTVLVLLERLTGQTAFALLGVRAPLYVREGVPRCMGTFRHAILLGSVAASLLPLYFGFYLIGVRRAAATCGLFLCIALVILSNSGGPITGTAAAALGWCLWPLRHKMRVVLTAAAVGFLIVAVTMKAPIWYLPFKISSLVGGGGYHRGLLMERAWQDLGRWWYAGIETHETIRWFPYVLPSVGSADITNEFLLFGVAAGVPAIIALALLLRATFQTVGQAVRSADHHRDKSRFLLWGLGVSIFVHIVNWFGVAYFDQSWAIWILHAAAISSIGSSMSTSTVRIRRTSQSADESWSNQDTRNEYDPLAPAI